MWGNSEDIPPTVVVLGRFAPSSHSSESKLYFLIVGNVMIFLPLMLYLQSPLLLCPLRRYL